MKNLFKSKTFWFNVITIAIGIVEVISKVYVIPADILALINGIGNVVLRMFSGQPVTLGRFTLYGGKKK